MRRFTAMLLTYTQEILICRSVHKPVDLFIDTPYQIDEDM